MEKSRWEQLPPILCGNCYHRDFSLKIVHHHLTCLKGIFFSFCKMKKIPLKIDTLDHIVSINLPESYRQRGLKDYMIKVT